MAGSTSAIQISSNALILLGHPPIASFEEPGAGAQAASNLYEQSYLNLLTIHRWRFATKKAQLSVREVNKRYKLFENNLKL